MDKWAALPDNLAFHMDQLVAEYRAKLRMARAHLAVADDDNGKAEKALANLTADGGKEHKCMCIFIYTLANIAL